MTNSRITPYESGWLSFLVQQGIASEADAREAMNRVAQAAVDHLASERRLKRRAKRRREDS